MQWQSRATSAVALAMSACVVVQSSMAPLLGAQAGSAAEPPPQPRRRPQTPDIDGGWPRDLDVAERRDDPRVPAADRELGRTESHGGVRRRVVHREGRRQAGARAPSSSRRTRRVAVDERLVNFSQVKITETHFPGLPNDQLREVTATITEGVPQGALMIALDRVLARLDKSQIIPKNVDGVKADPPVIFYSTLVGDPRQPRWRSDLEPDQGQRPPVRRQHQLGSLPAQPTKTFYLRHNQSWLQRRRREGTVEAGGQAAGQPSRSCRPTTTGRT